MEQASSLRLRGILELVRVPNMATACADVLAGYFILRWQAPKMLVIPLLLISSSFLYGAGCVMNDISDFSADVKRRPLRPLPSGRVSMSEAHLLQWSLVSIGILAAYTAGVVVGYTASVLFGLIYLYNHYAKRHHIHGPLVMASCRAANVLLGMSAAVPMVMDLRLVFPAVMFVYVLAITIGSFGEDGDHGQGQHHGLAIIAWGIAVVGMALFAARGSYNTLSYLLPFFALSAFGVFSLPRARNPAVIQRGVTIMILSIPLLDAVFVAGVQGWQAGIPSAACGATAFSLSLTFKVT